MAHTKLRQVAVIEIEKPKVAGKITITFIDVEGRLIPEVSFEPLGRINANTIEHNLPLIYREIQRRQALERKEPKG